jgi:Transposase DDE domain
MCVSSLPCGTLQMKHGFLDRFAATSIVVCHFIERPHVPLGYEVFAGNRHDATTLEEIVTHMEELYGWAGRVWIMDRGLASEKNVRFLRGGGRARNAKPRNK